MVFKGDEVVLISDQQRSISQEQIRERVDTHSADVRSIVAHQYALMEEAHDRIRTLELAAHRKESLVS